MKECIYKYDNTKHWFFPPLPAFSSTFDADTSIDLLRSVNCDSYEASHSLHSGPTPIKKPAECSLKHWIHCCFRTDFTHLSCCFGNAKRGIPWASLGYSGMNSCWKCCRTRNFAAYCTLLKLVSYLLRPSYRQYSSHWHLLAHNHDPWFDFMIGPLLALEQIPVSLASSTHLSLYSWLSQYSLSNGSHVRYFHCAIVHYRTPPLFSVWVHTTATIVSWLSTCYYWTL